MSGNMTQVDLYSKDGFQAVLIASINLERQIQISREHEIAKAVKIIKKKCDIVFVLTCVLLFLQSMWKIILVFSKLNPLEKMLVLLKFLLNSKIRTKKSI